MDLDLDQDQKQAQTLDPEQAGVRGVGVARRSWRRWEEEQSRYLSGFPSDNFINPENRQENIDLWFLQH